MSPGLCRLKRAQKGPLSERSCTTGRWALPLPVMWIFPNVFWTNVFLDALWLSRAQLLVQLGRAWDEAIPLLP